MEKNDLDASFQNAVALLDADWEDDRDWAFGHRLAAWRLADIVIPRVLRLTTRFQLQKPTLTPASLEQFMSLVTRASMQVPLHERKQTRRAGHFFCSDG